MDSAASHCPKCQGQMVQGFIIDQTAGGNLVSQWVAGAPRKSFWSGTKIDRSAIVPVAVFRCESCGYLESYAHDEYAPR